MVKLFGGGLGMAFCSCFYAGGDRLQVLWAHHLEHQPHDEGRPPLPHDLRCHHARVRMRRLVHFQHGSR